MQAPPTLSFDSHIFEVAFHPTQRIVATGLITGEVFVHSLDHAAGNKELFRLQHHRKSCRAMLFSENGEALFTASSDKTIQAVNMQTGDVFYKQAKAHSDPINTMLRISSDLIATGDDGGTIKLWDLRQQRATREYAAQDDYIADMAFNSTHNILLSASGDGTLGVYDIRVHKEVHVSDNQDDEQLSIAIMKGGNKVIVGTQEGVLNIWSWGLWGDISDRFPGHPNSIDTLAVVTTPEGEELLCSGSSDGLIRVMTILPNKLAGVVGDHDGFPVERIRVTNDQTLMASCSHDETVKFWDLAYLFADGEDDEEDDQMDAESSGPKGRARPSDSDEEESDDDSDNDDDDEMDDDKKPSRSRGKQSAKKARGGKSANFFADLD